MRANTDLRVAVNFVLDHVANWLAARMSGRRLASLLARTQSGACYIGNRRDDSLCLKQPERFFLPACSHPAELHKAHQALTDYGAEWHRI